MYSWCNIFYTLHHDINTLGLYYCMLSHWLSYNISILKSAYTFTTFASIYFILIIPITEYSNASMNTTHTDDANMPDIMEHTSMTPDGGEGGMDGQEMNKTMPTVATEPEPANSTAMSAKWSYRVFGLATLSVIIIN